jgi:hypothetical protein
LQLVLIVVKVICAHGQHDIDKVVHQDREKRYAEDLDDGADDFLGDRARVKITVAHCGQRC